jgi:hypothetical protein
VRLEAVDGKYHRVSRGRWTAAMREATDNLPVPRQANFLAKTAVFSPR